MIEEVKNNVNSLFVLYDLREYSKFPLSLDIEIKKVKKEILNSGLSYEELKKIISFSEQYILDMILIPPDTYIFKGEKLVHKTGYLTKVQFERCIKKSDPLTRHYFKMCYKLSSGRFGSPYSNIFDNFSINYHGSITCGVPDIVEIAKDIYLFSQKNKRKDLAIKGEHELFCVLMNSIKVDSLPMKLMKDAITVGFNVGDKKVALFNAASLYLMTEEFGLTFGELSKKDKGVCAGYFSACDKQICIDTDYSVYDVYNTCIHELGHAIHYFFRGYSLPANYDIMHSKFIKNVRKNEDLVKRLAEIFNFQSYEWRSSLDFDVSHFFKKDEIKNKEQAIFLAKLLAYDSDEEQFFLKRFETYEYDYALELCIMDAYKRLHYANNSSYEFNLDTLSGVLFGREYKCKDGEKIELDYGHSKKYFKSRKSSLFFEMYANYHNCRTYGDDMALNLLKKLMGEEIFNYLENIYDGVYSGKELVVRTEKTELNKQRDKRCDLQYIINTTYLTSLLDKGVDDNVLQEELESINDILYEEKYVLLFELYVFLINNFGREGALIHFIEFLNNSNYFFESALFKGWIDDSLISTIISENNFASLMDFIVKNVDGAMKNERFLEMYKNYGTSCAKKFCIVEGEKVMRQVDSETNYFTQFVSFYSNLGFKVFFDIERVEREREYLESYFRRLMNSDYQIPDYIKNIYVSYEPVKNLDDSSILVSQLYSDRIEKAIESKNCGFRI